MPYFSLHGAAWSLLFHSSEAKIFTAEPTIAHKMYYKSSLCQLYSR